MIKYIIFDIGGTIILNNSSNKSFEQVFYDFTKVNINKDIRKLLWTSNGNTIDILKKIPQLKYLEYVKLKNLDERLRNISLNNIMFFNDVLPILKYLKKRKIKIALLSNTSIWRSFNHIDFGLKDLINQTFLSCNIGLAKPDFYLFKYVEQKLKLNSKEILYIGDSLNYDIKPAIKFGWNAFLLDRNNKINLQNIRETNFIRIKNLLELKKIL